MDLPIVVGTECIILSAFSLLFVFQVGGGPTTKESQLALP